MSKRPHCINGELIFVKRALSRKTASIPERLIVTNRLVVHDSTRYNRTSLLEYFEQFGHIRQFDYQHGFIDYDVSSVRLVSFCTRGIVSRTTIMWIVP